jgi:hypothetical protein
MRAPRERDATSPRIAASRAADVAGPRMWDVTLETAVPAAAASPAEIRAMTFAAALGPDRAPFSTQPVEGDGDTIDLAGEEALLAYLATLTPSHA